MPRRRQNKVANFYRRLYSTGYCRGRIGTVVTTEEEETLDRGRWGTIVEVKSVELIRNLSFRKAAAMALPWRSGRWLCQREESCPPRWMKEREIVASVSLWSSPSPRHVSAKQAFDSDNLKIQLCHTNIKGLWIWKSLCSYFLTDQKCLIEDIVQGPHSLGLHSGHHFSRMALSSSYWRLITFECHHVFSLDVVRSAWLKT